MDERPRDANEPHDEPAATDAALGDVYLTTGPGSPMTATEGAFLADLDEASLPTARILRTAD